MSREIKFRAWSPSQQAMGEPFNLNDELLTNHFADNTDRWLGDTVFSQYTGLKDKNGVEIYEGDIVRAGTVESKDGAVRDMNVPVEYVRGIFEPIAYVTDDVLEVIGNIYENPELLGSRDGDE